MILYYKAILAWGQPWLIRWISVWIISVVFHFQFVSSMLVCRSCVVHVICSSVLLILLLIKFHILTDNYVLSWTVNIIQFSVPIKQYPWCRMDRSNCWPAVQHTTTMLWLPSPAFTCIDQCYGGCDTAHCTHFLLPVECMAEWLRHWTWDQGVWGTISLKHLGGKLAPKLV